MQRIIAAAICFAAAFAPSLAPGMARAETRVVPEDRMQVQLSYAPLVERAAPAVVNIYTKKIVRSRQTAPLFDDPFFRRFFGDFGFRFGPQGPDAQNSLGSGVIVRPDGLIVTNQHVIEGADLIKVVLADKREFDAEIVASDDKTDLAVLRVNPGKDSLPALPLKDSDELRVGDLVLAIGNPFGVGQTVTSGIVSALARTIGSGNEFKSFIQTDAAINPGNSGGALVSMDGRLVGVNTAIFSKSGGSHGIGFAIPSNMVRAVINGIRSDGQLVRPWLGTFGQTVTSDIATSLGMHRPQGVIVSQVHPSGSGGKAGIRPGDVILAVNGHDIGSVEDLDYRVATLPVGDTAVVRVLRGGKVTPLKVQLASAPERPAPEPTEIAGNNPLAGIVAANLSPALAEREGLDPLGEGVVVLRLRRGSTAARLGFQPGDIVRVVNGTAIAAVRDLKKAASAERKNWEVRVERGGKAFDFVFRG